MKPNEFILEEALVNQSFKKMMMLLSEKIAKHEKLTPLEVQLKRYVHLNWCLAELLGPIGKTISRQDVKSNSQVMSQFPSFRRVFNTIHVMRQYHDAHQLPYTPLEEAFLRYLEVATEVGMKVAARGNKKSNENKPR